MKSTTFALTALVGSAAAVPAFSNSTASAGAAAATYSGSCQAQYDDCRSVKDPNNPPNYSACAAAYSSCLGYNPFASNASSTVAPTGTGAAAPTNYVTQIVTSLETYCPSATVLTYNSKTYTVTAATTLTVTDCPCQHVVPVTEVPPAKTITAVVQSFTTVCPTPTVITTKSKTYTVTSATTLTITHCPGGCTVTGPASYVCPTTYYAPTTYPMVAPSLQGSVVPSMAPKVTVTKMVSSYTTYCPAPTTITAQGSTYTASSATTLTIGCPTGCPVVTVVPAPSAPAPAPSGPAAPPKSQAPAPSGSAAPPMSQAPAPAPSASVGGGRPVSQISDGQIQAPPATSAKPYNSASATASGPAQYTGAAEKVMAGGSVFAAGVAALFML